MGGIINGLYIILMSLDIYVRHIRIMICTVRPRLSEQFGAH